MIFFLLNREGAKDAKVSFFNPSLAVSTKACCSDLDNLI
jgi:hypothetical protein